ncbi:MAG TPA: hypothetical protein PKE00_01175 [Planctomycetota bacterium]|nr:hypothetical protein [Planctomycetota bacterium]
MTGTTQLHARYVPSAPLLALRIDFFMEHVEEVLLEGLSLREIPLASDEAVLETDWNAERVGVDARHFVGQGPLSRVAILRGTSFDGSFESVSILALSDPGRSAPIFFLEALAIDNTWDALLLDICCSSTEYPELRGLALELQDSGDVLEHGLAPFASEAMIAVRGVVPEDFSVDHTMARYLDSFVASLHGAGVRASRDEGRRLQRRFLEHGRKLWSKANNYEQLFGAAALAYVPRVLFDPSVV